MAVLQDITLEQAADKAARDAGLDPGTFRKGQGSIYEGGGMNDGRVRDALAALQAEQATNARKQREAELNQRKETLVNQQGDNTRRQLAENMAGIKSQANKRGMLYSGLHQSAQAGAGNQAANSMASFRQGANQATAQDLDQYNASRAGQGLIVYQNQVNDAGQKYQEAMGNMQQRNQNISGIMGGLGAAAGLIGGKK